MGRNLINLSGKQFGRLTVVRRATNRNGKTYWLCECSCGNKKEVLASGLVSGGIKSCGYLHHDLVIERNKNNKIIKHMKCNERIYRIWKAIKQRCYNANHNKFEYYGGRGIIVCNEWLNNFVAFYQWAMNNGYSDKLTIERMDVNGNYEPNNCKWITIQEQQYNKRNNHLVQIGEEMYTLMELSKLTGIPFTTLYNRVSRGVSGEKLINMKG